MTYRDFIIGLAAFVAGWSLAAWCPNAIASCQISREMSAASDEINALAARIERQNSLNDCIMKNALADRSGEPDKCAADAAGSGR